MKATFAAGCFWHVEEVFNNTTGVISTKVGYTGGTMPNPSYQDVCGDYTGHAEAVQIEYDPNIVSYDTLLDIFWKNHNPTTLNRQGPDVGSQYRSAIFFHNDTQMEIAHKSLQNTSKLYDKPIVTEIRSALPFYDAEEYHQKYLQKHQL